MIQVKNTTTQGTITYNLTNLTMPCHLLPRWIC